MICFSDVGTILSMILCGHLQVESPIFQDMPLLPSPLGTFVYTQVFNLMRMYLYNLPSLILSNSLSFDDTGRTPIRDFFLPLTDLRFLQFKRLPLLDRMTAIRLMYAGDSSTAYFYIQMSFVVLCLKYQRSLECINSSFAASGHIVNYIP